MSETRQARRPEVLAARAVDLKTDGALTGAAYDIYGGHQLVT